MIKIIKLLSVFIAIGISLYNVTKFSEDTNFKYMFIVAGCVVYLFVISMYGIFKNVIYKKNYSKTFENLEINELNHKIREQDGIITELDQELKIKNESLKKISKQIDEYQNYINNLNNEIINIDFMGLSEKEKKSFNTICDRYVNSIKKVIKIKKVFVYFKTHSTYECVYGEGDTVLNYDKNQMIGINIDEITDEMLVEWQKDGENKKKSQYLIFKNSELDRSLLMVIENAGKSKIKRFEVNYSKVLFNLLVKSINVNGLYESKNKSFREAN